MTPIYDELAADLALPDPTAGDYDTEYVVLVAKAVLAMAGR